MYPLLGDSQKPFFCPANSCSCPHNPVPCLLPASQEEPDVAQHSAASQAQKNKDPLQGQDYSWAESPFDSSEKRAQPTQSSYNLETLTHCKCLDLSLHHLHSSPALSSPPLSSPPLSIYPIEPNAVSAQLVKPSEFPLKIWHPSSSPGKWFLSSVFTACIWFAVGLKLYHFYRFKLRLKTKIYGSLKNRPDSQLLVQQKNC